MTEAQQSAAKKILRYWEYVSKDGARVAKLEDWLWDEGMDVTPERIEYKDPFGSNGFTIMWIESMKVNGRRQDPEGPLQARRSYMMVLKMGIYRALKYLIDKNTE